MKPAVVLKDVAKAAGVSVTTASQVLNNYPNISERTRREVWRAKERLGYEPNAHARSLRIRRGHDGTRSATGNLALVIIDPVPTGSHFYMDLVHGFSRAVQDHDLHPLVLTLTAIPQSDRELSTSLRNREVDGILLTGVLPAPVIARFVALGLPCVILGNEDVEPDCSIVKPDVAGSTFAAMKKLFTLGHTAISLVTQRLDTCYHREILEAYKLSYARRGLAFREEWIRNIGSPLGGPEAEVDALLALSPRPTATLFTNTRSAGLAYDRLQAAGIRVPGEMSMITFSGTSETDIRASIDRMVVDNAMLGLIGTKTLLDRIAAPGQPGIVLSVPCASTEGGSCAAAPAVKS